LDLRLDPTDLSLLLIALLLLLQLVLPLPLEELAQEASTFLSLSRRKKENKFITFDLVLSEFLTDGG
jgi:hypothetical protein